MALKLRKRSLFPAVVQVTSPLTLTKTGAVYEFGVDPTQGALGPTGAGYGGTSETSLEIATGAQFFETQSGYAYQAGNYIRASSAADGTNYMEGTITSYADTTMVVEMTRTSGSGTFADWTFSLAGTPGANGAGSGDMLAAQNLDDVSNKRAAKDNISVHGADIASASTIDLEAATGDLVDVTGTTSITAITLNEGHERTVRFTGALTLTHGSSLVLPGAANITTAAGDFAVFRGYGASVVRCVGYTPAAKTGTGGVVHATNPTITAPEIVGATSGSAPATGRVGEYLSSTVAGGSPVAITSGANNVWNTLSITAGCWLVGGNVAVIKTGGTTPTFTHMHADHNASGSTTIATAPAGGSTIALHVDSNDPNGWCFPMGIRPYNVSTTTTVRAVMLPDFTGGTAGAYGVLWAVRIA